MQEVSATKTATDRFDLLRTSALVDTSSQARAFSDFLGLLSQASQSGLLSSTGVRAASAQDLSPYLGAVQQSDNSGNNAASGGFSTVAQAAPVAAPAPAVAQTGAQAATQTSAQTTSQTATQTSTAQSRQSSSEASLASRNTPVSREAFEEAKPLLLKAGLSDKEIQELSAKTQAGTLTWGQLVQSLGGHMSGGKKAVQLSSGEKLELQTMFQKLGFAQDVSAQLMQSMASGDGQKVLAAVQAKLASLDSDSSSGVSSNELATFFKALRVPQATADTLTKMLGENSTVAGLKTALAAGSQALQEQFVKTSGNDVQIAKSLGKIMEKDVAKATRDGSQSTAQTATESGGAQVAFELKTKDKNDTSWFDQRDKNQQQKSSADSWRDFIAKVRSDDSGAQSTAATQQAAAKAAAADTLAAATRSAGLSAQTAAQTAGQTKAETAAQARPFDKVAAPKVLDQVTEAMLKDLGQGRKQLTLSLDPDSLGKIQVMLQVKGKEVSAVLQAENAETANLISTQMESLKKTLEDQGLTVQNLEVQTGLASNQQQQQLYTADEHNQAQERQEMTRLMSQLRMLRTDGADMAQDMQNADVQAIFADNSLHLIA